MIGYGTIPIEQQTTTFIHISNDNDFFLTYHFSKNLRSKIFGSSTQRLGCITFDILFTQAEVSNTDMAFRIQEKVLWLQITVDNLILVQMCQAKGNFSSIELGTIL